MYTLIEGLLRSKQNFMRLPSVLSLLTFHVGVTVNLYYLKRTPQCLFTRKIPTPQS